MFLHSKSHRAVDIVTISIKYIFENINFTIVTWPRKLCYQNCTSIFQQQKSTYKFNDFKHLMNKKQGLLLFSGPTGSGKSTLMYQMVSYANKALNLNVISIEDPVEMQIPGIVQINVNDKLALTM